MFRKKRDVTEFHSALAECEPDKCTIIKCTMGPMEKDEQLLLKVKSRIFTETLVKVSIVLSGEAPREVNRFVSYVS